MIGKIYGLFIAFCAEQKAQGKEIYGLKIYPGDPVEWCIEFTEEYYDETYGTLGIAQAGATLNYCLQVLACRTRYHEADNTYTASATIVYDLWQRYYPIHHRFHESEESDIFPYLLFHSDYCVSIQDLEADIEWHGKLEEAIALLNFCISQQCSFSSAKIF